MIDFLNKPLFLAPLAGFSDPPLRSVVKQFGCDVTVSEMISSNALVFENDKTLKMLEKSELETPFIVQIAGSDALVIKKAVEVINKFDGIDGIDLNCGCPVQKVVKQCAGSALLLDLDNLSTILETIRKYSNKKLLSAKIRLGFDEKIPRILAKRVEDAGVDFITVHGRTRSGGYSAKVDYEAILEAKEAVSIPLVANGDISSQNAKFILSATKADGLMIGRGSIGKPWVFHEIKTGDSVDETTKNRIILCHFEEMIKYYGAHGVAIFRKHLHEYSKGLENASSFREEVNHINDCDLMRDKILEFFKI
ncbi:tRNA dihydrouridine synthase [Campylobacter geochelonis]|uniref:tRNA-dihydrouridine synthase n=1 Tax=Campylobacter geochelonis TaxID=1780362 RepID=A0A128E9P6_9BACT|nr:tRNA-dihydrouridine synthase [Campylobacter geochelonis]QKF70719.1 tRNA-dihydrouridine synthase B [Campylobacter geochelonis]CZE45724.1 tRNA-dihydrouridine synthase B [Campylobacter geochelonis]